MPSFVDEPHQGRLDWVLMRDGPVVRYQSLEVLESDVLTLAGLGYEVSRFDCSAWVDERSMHSDFKDKLRFPDYYGSNLSALKDCLRNPRLELTIGSVLVLINFDAVSTEEKHGPNTSLARSLLDIFARCSWTRLLYGDRLLVLLQVGEGWNIGSFGAKHALLNLTEWLDGVRVARKRSRPDG